MTPRTRLTTIAAVGILTLCACAGSSDGSSSSIEPTVVSAPATTGDGPTTQTFPDVIGADATEVNGTWRFDVTISSPYDSPERYADAWRIVGDDGIVYGVRELTHDHANEQPFTRSLSDVAIPDGVALVTVEARDLLNGYGGQTLEVALVRS
jgi:hypothetical protein